MVIDSPSDFHHKAYHKADYEYARMRTTIERIRDIRLQLLDFLIISFFGKSMPNVEMNLLSRKQDPTTKR